MVSSTAAMIRSSIGSTFESNLATTLPFLFTKNLLKLYVIFPLNRGFISFSVRSL
jgi:hypothetical protein